MLVGRCSSELSGHKLQAKSKKSQALSEDEAIPAMLVGRCSSELSSHKLQAKIKSHKLRAKTTCPGVPWRDLLLRGDLLETTCVRYAPRVQPAAISCGDIKDAECSVAHS